MKRPGAGEKILVAVTVSGAVAIVVAIAFFSVTGSGLGADLLLFAGGFAQGALVVGLLTKPPRRGRLLSALVYAALIAGCLVFALTRPDWLIVSVKEGTGGSRFVSGLVASTAGASLARLFGLLNVPGSREPQPSRWRS